MSLPKLSHPIFETIQPSTGKKLKFRPFTGREQKNLLIAKESDEQADVVRAVAAVVGECFGMDAGKIPMFDLEYLFMILRGKSVENTVKIGIRDDEDGKMYDAVVDLDNIKVKNDAVTGKKDKFEVVPGIGIKLRWPTVDSVLSMGDKEIDEWAVLAASVDSVWNGEEVTSASDTAPGELKEWLMELPVSTMEPIKEFFENRPQVEVAAKYKKADGAEVTKVVSGLSNFFV